MEEVRRAVKQIAYTRSSHRLSTLSPSQLSLIPILSFASSLYTVALYLRHQLYRFNILRKHRLPVPVISVGNLTWGGNGKTPMVEFLARSLDDVGISSLILTRGYGGADEAKMLQRQLQGTFIRIGVGANRAATASTFLQQYGYVNYHDTALSSEEIGQVGSHSVQIGAAILDDGMQHLSVWRDLEIVMVNAMVPWGNHQLLPLGPLREPLTALSRADIVVLHHADLVKKEDIEALESTIGDIKRSIPTFFTKMTPTHLLALGDVSKKIPLKTIHNSIVLCISGVGFADSFIRSIGRIGPVHVDHVDFSDHHSFTLKDMDMIRRRLEALETRFLAQPIVVITEKDYDRTPEVFEHLKPYKVLVLSCRLQFLEHRERTESCFKKIVFEHLKVRL